MPRRERVGTSRSGQRSLAPHTSAFAPHPSPNFNPSRTTVAPDPRPQRRPGCQHDQLTPADILCRRLTIGHTARQEVSLGALVLVMRAESRRRWRAWLALVLLVAFVGGVVLGAIAAGRRTDSALPSFLAAHGFDAAVYSTKPWPSSLKLPEVTSVTELIGPDTGQPTCRLRSPDQPNGLRRHLRTVRPTTRCSSSSPGACPTRRPPTRYSRRSPFNKMTGCTWAR